MCVLFDFVTLPFIETGVSDWKKATEKSDGNETRRQHQQSVVLQEQVVRPSSIRLKYNSGLTSCKEQWHKFCGSHCSRTFLEMFFFPLQ